MAEAYCFTCEGKTLNINSEASNILHNSEKLASAREAMSVMNDTKDFIQEAYQK